MAMVLIQKMLIGAWKNSWRRGEVENQQRTKEAATRPAMVMQEVDIIYLV
jgi:hypothetical protein